MSFHCVGWVMFVKLVKHFGFIDTVCSNHMTEIITSAKKKSKIHNKSLTPILLVLRIHFSSLQVAHIHYMWLCYVDKSILKASTLYITAPSSMWPHLFANLHMTVYRNAKCWSVSIFSFLSFSTAQSLCHRNWTESRLEWGRDDERYFRDQVLHLFHSVYDYYKLSILKNNHIVPFPRSFYSLHVLRRCKISYCDNNAVPNFYHLAPMR